MLGLCGVPGLATFPPLLAVGLAAFGDGSVHFLQPAVVGVPALVGLALAAGACRRTDAHAPAPPSPTERWGRTALVLALVAGGLLPGQLADGVRPTARKRAATYLQARCVGVSAGNLRFPAVRERLGVECEDATESLRAALRQGEGDSP